MVSPASASPVSVQLRAGVPVPEGWLRRMKPFVTPALTCGATTAAERPLTERPSQLWSLAGSLKTAKLTIAAVTWMPNASLPSVSSWCFAGLMVIEPKSSGALLRT